MADPLPGPNARISVVIPVYRDGLRARSAVAALKEQRLPAGTSLEIVVVDDGSDDDTAALVPADGTTVRLVRLPQNRGRSIARNSGAEASTGAWVVFIDSDCVPADRDFLATHLQLLTAGAVATTGHVTGVGGGFWERYQHQASLRRERQHASGCLGAGSSQNLAVARNVFMTAGGFDAAYHRYGFEDRDLLLRISRFGRVAWANDAMVVHTDVIRLADVVRKMREAGRHTSARFADTHADAYRVLGYASLDTGLHPWLRPVARICGPLAAPLAQACDYLIEKKLLPFTLAGASVKALSALAFMHGTALRDPLP